MSFVVIVVTVVSVTVTLLTKPTEEERLKQFILRVRPFHFFWMPVIRRLDCHFEEAEGFGRTMVSWVLAMASVYSLMFGIGKLLLGSPLVGIACVIIFLITLWLTVQRVNQDMRAVEARDEAEGKKASSITTRASGG